MVDRYNVSKLLEVLICREIAREHPVDQTKVTLNFVTYVSCPTNVFPHERERGEDGERERS